MQIPASADEHGRRAHDAKDIPKSLMQRLSLLEKGLLPLRNTVASGAPGLVRTFFALGLAASALLGGAALLALSLTSGGTAVSPPVPAVAAARTDASPPTSAQAAAKSSLPAAHAVTDVALSRNEPQGAPFPLRVSGTGVNDELVVIVRNLPANASLSRGKRWNDRTWAVPVSELDDLRMRVPGEAPETFELAVDVATARGDRVASTTARVRLVDPPQPPRPSTLAAVDSEPARTAEPTSSSHIKKVTAAAEPPKAAASPRITSATATTVVRPKQVAEAPVAPVPRPGREVARPPLPQGISALGGPAPDARPAPNPVPDGRRMWWKMPGPEWRPFEAERR